MDRVNRMDNYRSFKPGTSWKDVDGEPIQAHGGCLLRAGGITYWYGENKNADNVPGQQRVDVIGVSCYSSVDLYHWRHEGIVLHAAADDETHDLHPSKVAERPKVLYNERTGQYVMWLHVDHEDYSYARVGVAVSDNPAGPFHYRGSFRPADLDSRDMTLFQDDDGKAYVLFSSNWNSCLVVADLTDDYLGVKPTYSYHFAGTERHSSREAPAIFKHDGRYYLITSGCTGWKDNAAELAVATQPHGPWTVIGNPCVGDAAELTFHAQGTYIAQVAGMKDAFLFMADRWNPDRLRDSTYVWLPVRFKDGNPYLEWQDEWDLGVFRSDSR